MKAKNLVVLLVVAIALGVAAMYSKRSKEEPSDVIGSAVLADLPVNDIERIVVTSPSSTSHLARVNNVWVSEDSFNYPADFSRIKSAIVKVADMTVGQVVDAEADDKVAMKMVAPAGGDVEGAGTLLDMLDTGGQRLASLLIGESRKRSSGGQGPYGGYPDGQFVSPDEGDTIYLVKDNLYEFNQASDWLDKTVLNVPGTDIASVRIAGPDRDTLDLRMADNGSDLVLDELGDKEEMDSSLTGSIKSALSYLRFESVADPSLSSEELGLDAPATFTGTTRKGEIYTVQIGAKAADSENRYARIQVALAPVAEEAPAEEDAEQTEEAKQAAEAEKARKAEERAKQKLQMVDLNAKLSPWTYVIASHKTDTMMSAREQVVKAIEEEEEEDQESEVTGQESE